MSRQHLHTLDSIPYLMSNPTWDLLLSCARVKYLSKTSIQIPFLLVFNSSLALISISLESDQLSSILKTTINANPAVSSNVGSKIVWSKSAAIKKSSAMRRPLNILATILRTYTCRRSFLILERSSWTKLANVIITIAATTIATIISIMMTMYSTIM